MHRSPLSAEEPNAVAVAEELDTLRAEVIRLRRALESRSERDEPRPRRMMEADPDLPGLIGLWRGERGLAWQLFVQAVVTINVVLAVIAAVVFAVS